uniref:Ig-like domain-containing protein n=1 Tax=Junco hyemalis TaxID=40217 RepID=A0A8C5JE28_JUNHY
MLGTTPVCVGSSSPQLPWQCMVMNNSISMPSLLRLWFELFLSTLSQLSGHTLPPLFKEQLKDQEAEEGAEVSLLCELSKAAPVQWQKDQRSLKPSGKYRMRQEGLKAELVIRGIAEEDAGEYTCVCGEQQTTAVLTVQGKAIPDLLSPAGNLCPVL